MSFNSELQEIDSEISHLIEKENDRQSNQIELIASENFVSKAVLETQGSILTNKYAEGYPAKRYYGGCEYYDEIENLGIKRVCEIFNCNFANIQPHSGASANLATYLAFLKPGDTILGMSTCSWWSFNSWCYENNFWYVAKFYTIWNKRRGWFD